MLTPQRRPYRRAYFFEIFVAANFVALLALAWGNRATLFGTATQMFVFATQFVIDVLVGVAIRSVVAVVRGERAYFRIIRSSGWLTDTLRLVVICTLAVYTYAFIKLFVPIYHPRLFDQELWNLDRMIFFGMSPNIFFLDIFSQPMTLRIVDWSYAKIFLASNFLAFAYFLSAPSRRVRIAFATGNLAMWLTGSWLYMLVPSLGPAYRFPDIWLEHARQLELTQFLQALLMKNYQSVLRAVAGQTSQSISILFGIGAFPSMHVAYQTFVFLWMRKLWTWGEVIFAIFVIAIFLGSLITGWHYLIDAISGVVLALGFYLAVARAFRMKRWIQNYEAFRRVS